MARSPTERHIRIPKLQDLSDIAQVVAPLQFFAPTNDPTELLRTWQRALKAGDTFLAAFDGDNPQGLCQFSSSGTFGTGAYLKLIIVVPAAQSKGVGTELLAAFENGCSPRGGYFVLTQQSNEAAQRFYDRHGYKVVGQMLGFAAPDRTDLILWKMKVPSPA